MQGMKKASCCGGTTFKNRQGKEGKDMDFLKEVLGEELYKQFVAAVTAHNDKPENKDNQIKLANLEDGQYVDKRKYDTAVAEKANLEGQIETLNGTVKTLKKDNQDNEGLQKTIADLQEDLKRQQEENENTVKTYALKESLAKTGVLDPDYLIYKAGGIESFTFDKENHPIGVEDTIKPYKEDMSMAHLFRQDTKKPPYNPQNGGAGGAENPFAKETYNMTKQGELLRENPEQARAMAAAAGVTI